MIPLLANKSHLRDDQHHLDESKKLRERSQDVVRSRNLVIENSHIFEHHFYEDSILYGWTLGAREQLSLFVTRFSVADSLGDYFNRWLGALRAFKEGLDRRKQVKLYVLS